jgi:hypothetical protein
MTDRLAALLGHFSVSARTFQSGPLCGINSLDANDPFGQLHLIQQGDVEVWHGNKFEVVLIQLLRHLMEDGSAEIGMMAGLTHPQLRRSLVAIHEAPARNWTVESLATVAGMSRSVFANQFHEKVGAVASL